MGKRIIITETDLVKLIKKIINESLEHYQRLYKNWASNKSGNPELAMSVMDDFFRYQKSLPKKDFIQYKSAEELKTILDNVKMNMGAKKESEKIYEDKNLLVVMAKSWEASCKYGAGTKWCTAWDKDNSYWKRHNATGTEFIWINKNIPADNPIHKLSLHIKNNRSYDWCDATNRCSAKDLYKLNNMEVPKNYQDIIDKCFNYHEQHLNDKQKEAGENGFAWQQSDSYIRIIEFIDGVDFEELIDDYKNQVIGEAFSYYGKEESEQIIKCINEKVSERHETIKEDIKEYINDEFEEFLENADDDDEIIYQIGVQVEEMIYEIYQECTSYIE